MACNWGASIGIIRDGSIDTWLRRALGDDIMVSAINVARSVVAEADNDDNLIGRFCIALDPMVPIRYRKFRAAVEEIPNVLALYGETGSAREDFVQLMQHGLIEFWDQNQPNPRMEFITLYRDLKRAHDVMGRSSSGDGIERAIYDLNPGLACQPPLVEAYYVLNAYQLLPALNRLGEDTSEAVVLIDNHIAAYIAAHFASHRDAELRDPDNQVDPCLPVLAAVRLLARIQEKAAKVRAYPKLGMLAVKLLEPTVKRFFNRSTREKISSATRARQAGLRNCSRSPMTNALSRVTQDGSSSR